MPIALLSETLDLSDGSGLEYTVTLTAADNPYADAEYDALQSQIQMVLRTLSEREASAIWDRINGETQAQVAAKLGISIRKLREIEKGAMRKLRHPARSQLLKDYWGLG